jgi:hypothetical protein
MCTVKTSVGTWSTGDQSFSDVTLVHGTGLFNLLYSPANRHRPEDSTFHAADHAERSSVPVQITLRNKKAERQCQSKRLILPGGRLESV